MARDQKGAVMIGILVVSVAGWAIVPESELPDEFVSTPESPMDTVGAVFSAFGNAGDEITDMDGNVTYGGWGSFMMVMIAFFFVDLSLIHI